MRVDKTMFLLGGLNEKKSDTNKYERKLQYCC